MMHDSEIGSHQLGTYVPSPIAPVSILCLLWKNWPLRHALQAYRAAAVGAGAAVPGTAGRTGDRAAAAAAGASNGLHVHRCARVDGLTLGRAGFSRLQLHNVCRVSGVSKLLPPVTLAEDFQL